MGEVKFSTIQLHPFILQENVVKYIILQRHHNSKYYPNMWQVVTGKINPNEKAYQAAVRELKEETGIKINVPELRNRIVESKVFDDPMRSSRGRTVSHTFVIDLGVGALPKVKGADDAKAAMWLPLNEFYMLEDKFFEDHYHIIMSLISKH